MITKPYQNECKNTQNNARALIFLQQNHCVTSTKLLCQLTKKIQQHRGFSTGFLSGEKSFFTLSQKLQRNIETTLNLLKTHNKSPYNTLSKEDINNINNGWKTISIDWKNDQISHNFEFHSHLIEILKKLIRHCAQEYLLRPKVHSSTSYPALIEMLFSQIPENTESLAIIRGLSTNITTTKTCTENNRSRLIFLLKSAQGKNNKLIESIKNLANDYKQIPSISTLKSHQNNFYAFSQGIHTNLINNSSTNENSTVLFRLSTTIIDAYWLALEQGLQAIDQFLYDHCLES